MNDKTMREMKDYKIDIDDIQKQQVIDLGKRKIMEKHLCRYSLFDLLRSSVRFTRFHTWLIQFFLLASVIFFITRIINNEPSIFIIQSLTVAVIFSVTFYMDELFRSFISGMWELEQTLKYDLRQHTIMKLLIFGLTDLLLIICLACVSQGVLAISFWQMILYLLVPFNITCIVLFSLFTFWRNNFSSFVFWIGSGITLMCVLIITNLFNIYEFGIAYWMTGYVISILFLGFIVMNMINVKKWEAFF